MASSPVDAVNLTQEQLVKSLIEKIRWNVEIAPFWPYRGVVGGLLRYARTAQLAAADMDDLATILADNANVVDNTPAADQGITYTLGELSSRYKIDYNAQDRWKYQNLDDVLAVIACMRCLLMSFRKLDLDAVPAAAGDYPSLYEMCDPGQIVDGLGAAPTLDLLQETWHLVVAGTRPNVIMCNRRASRAIIKAYNEAGLNPQEVELMFPDPVSGKMTPRKVPGINGTPILINDLIATDVSDLTRIYMMVMGEDCEKGIYGVTGIVPKDLLGKLFIRRESAEPSGSSTSQLNVTYAMPTATAMGCASALAILEDVLV